MKKLRRLSYNENQNMTDDKLSKLTAVLNSLKKEEHESFDGAQYATWRIRDYQSVGEWGSYSNGDGFVPLTPIEGLIDYISEGGEMSRDMTITAERVGDRLYSTYFEYEVEINK